MDTGKIYWDSEGDECNVLQMVKREPQWAANRIQEGEKSEAKLTAKDKQIEVMREALEFYADEDNYMLTRTMQSKIAWDEGTMAAKVIARLDGGEG